MKRLIRKQIGYSSVEYEVDNHEKTYTDTKVIINDQLLCVINKDEINDFHSELTNIVKKYNI